MSLTTNRNDPNLGYGVDDKPIPQNKVYLVLSEEELAKGYLKPFRTSYKHSTCGTVTTMNDTISATYARDPWFYGSTYCCDCNMHRPLHEFVWLPDGESMSPNEWSDEEYNRVVELRKRLESK